MGLLNLKVCQATCVIGVIASISAIASLILGFILMGTFHATYVHTCVGIWCGLLMFLHVITSGVMLGSRKYVAGILYIIANFVCLAFTVYGIIVAYDYFKSFSDYRKYNDEGACALKLGTCRCSPVKGGYKAFRQGYEVSECALFSFGENIWITILVFTAINALWSLIGLFIGLVAICAVCAVRSEIALIEKSVYKHEKKAKKQPALYAQQSGAMRVM